MAWEVDYVHSTIEFSAKHMMVTSVRGRFNKFTANIDINEQEPEKSEIDVTIDAASIQTNSEQRDGHLKSPDFFDVATNPNITYKSKKIEKIGENHYTVLGDMTVRDVTHELPLDVTFEGEGTTPYGKRIAAFSAKATLVRKDFGLGWNVALETGGWLVSEKVGVDIEVQVLEKVEAPAEATA
jgi:polyisoprenoid-binding protein YceI